MFDIGVAPRELVRIDDVWHRMYHALSRYRETDTHYTAECGAATTILWRDDRINRWSYDPFGGTPRPEPICPDCQRAYAKRLRTVADQVEANV